MWARDDQKHFIGHLFVLYYTHRLFSYLIIYYIFIKRNYFIVFEYINTWFFKKTKNQNCTTRLTRILIKEMKRKQSCFIKMDSDIMVLEHINVIFI